MKLPSAERRGAGNVGCEAEGWIFGEDQSFHKVAHWCLEEISIEKEAPTGHFSFPVSGNKCIKMHPLVLVNLSSLQFPFDS